MSEVDMIIDLRFHKSANTQQQPETEKKFFTDNFAARQVLQTGQPAAFPFER